MPLSWQAVDAAHYWHPCTQMQEHETLPPLEIAGAEGCWLITPDGRRVFDAVSSWWCKSLGHGHPRLRRALIEQAGRFEHVIGAGTVQEPSARLSEVLGTLIPGLSRVFYAGDGSMAVEVAVKMALQAQALKGQGQRTRIASLAGGYHGETALTLALGDVGLYKGPYSPLYPTGFQTLGPVPTHAGPLAPGWEEAEPGFEAWLPQLEGLRETCAALVLEPLLQGAGGMRLYRPDFLRRLATWAHSHGIYLIADEILTGFWRTGSRFACEAAGIVPDFLCMSKGLTGGWLPFSAVLLREEVYWLFYGPYAPARNFLHSNTFTGNALGAAVALEAQRIYAEPDFGPRVKQVAEKVGAAMHRLADSGLGLRNPRALGVMAAADWEPAEKTEAATGVFPGRDFVLGLQTLARKRGLFLRPLGNTVYWLPPLTVADREIDFLEESTGECLWEWNSRRV